MIVGLFLGKCESLLYLIRDTKNIPTKSIFSAYRSGQMSVIDSVLNVPLDVGVIFLNRTFKVFL